MAHKHSLNVTSTHKEGLSGVNWLLTIIHIFHWQHSQSSPTDNWQTLNLRFLINWQLTLGGGPYCLLTNSFKFNWQLTSIGPHYNPQQTHRLYFNHMASKKLIPQTACAGKIAWSSLLCWDIIIDFMMINWFHIAWPKAIAIGTVENPIFAPLPMHPTLLFYSV